MIEQEQQVLKQIVELLPTGYVKGVPYDISKDVSFEFNVYRTPDRGLCLS